MHERIPLQKSPLQTRSGAEKLKSSENMAKPVSDTELRAKTWGFRESSSDCSRAWGKIAPPSASVFCSIMWISLWTLLVVAAAQENCGKRDFHITGAQQSVDIQLSGTEAAECSYTVEVVVLIPSKDDRSFVFEVLFESTGLEAADNVSVCSDVECLRSAA